MLRLAALLMVAVCAAAGALFFWMTAAGDAPTGASSGTNSSYAKSRVYVVSLQGVPGADPSNSGRLDKFVAGLTTTCGADVFEVMHCPGELNPRRGFGVTRAFVRCMERAVADGVDMALFFEDDARLKSSDFCSGEYRASLWSRLPPDAYLLLLGAHVIQYVAEAKDGFRPSRMSFGAYGFCVPQKYLEHLRNGFVHDLRSKSDMISPDAEFYTHARRRRKVVYIASPFIVKHSAGWSNTWFGPVREIL
jgi:hypothetical protein